MASRLEIADVTAPADTTAAGAVEVALGFPAGVLRRWTIVIPDGHSGLTGIALGYGGQPVVPYRQPAFISGNDEVVAADWLDKVPGVPWSAWVCNLDVIDHVFEVRFEYDELATASPIVPAAPLAVESIYAAATRTV